MDEEALRRLLHDVVEDVEPSHDALEHLRRAVPARRTRRRQALVGAAAALLFMGTAVPALVHVAGSGGVDDDRRANAASSQDTPGGEDGAGKGGKDGNAATVRPTGEPAKGGRHGKGGKKGGASERPGGTTAGGVQPSETMAATSPTCTPDQLGNAAASSGSADSEGKIYGYFRVVNVSGSACTVGGAGSVDATAQGSADQSRIQVVNHTSGDAATGLPDPSMEQTQLILAPGQAYEVKFAWVPADSNGGCPVAGSSPDPGSTGSTGDPATGTESQTTAEEPAATQPEGSVAISHTPQAGASSAATTTISNVCAGTIYRTGILAAS